MFHYFGHIIRSLRIDCGLTQKQVAKAIEVAPVTVGRWENDAKYPSTERLIKLAELFHVSLNYLVGLDDEKSISLDGLSETQKSILVQLVSELQNKQAKGLTDTRQMLLGRTIKEFDKVNK